MGRWEPNARGRLAEAAMELFQERGFEQTTVAGIAERAGLTERTFFRYFADKREVLFSGSEILQELLVAAVTGAPAALSPIEAVITGLDAASAMLRERHAFAPRRAAVIAANPDLRERELIKLASLGSAMADALRRRGVKDPTASLAAEAGMAAFRIGFERWIADTDQDLASLFRDSLEDLRAVLAAPDGG